ncbi:MAG: histidinol dehydrogenase [Deltaproteobacteria bacterium]
MLTPINYADKNGKARVHALASRRLELAQEHEKTVRSIIEDVRARGDQALVEYTARFDAPDFTPDHIRVGQDEIDAAYQAVDEAFLSSIRKSISNVEAFHIRQLPQSWFMTRENGVILGQMIRPVDSCGLYVPGGKGGTTPLVSSVVMNAVPARIAGVERIALATPPTSGCLVSPYLLVAAAECGVKEIFRMGSAWAIAALAFGTESVLPVDVIVGPGNIFVTLAKKLVSGMVGIDMIAGPSEVLIIADETAVPSHIASDLLSQAEHDPLATSILITPSQALAEAVSKELEQILKTLARKDVATRAIDENGLILVVDNLDSAVMIANRIAPEHLEIATQDPWAILPQIRHAGAVFLGHHTPEPIGDYIAGPNHVLPTMGSARFSSALGVETFLKRSSIISYSEKAFQEDAQDVVRLAEKEGLFAHALSVQIRLGKR